MNQPSLAGNSVCMNNISKHFSCTTHSYSQRTPLHGLYQVRITSLAFIDLLINLSNSATSGTCTTTTITNWAKTVSAYIKSLDCNHLVGLGDEGWFYWGSGTDHAYECVLVSCVEPAHD